MAMVPSMATVLRALSQTGRFLFVLYAIWMFLALGVVCLIVYNRQSLLEIGSTVTHRKPYFKFRISQGKAKEELYASWSKILGAIGRMHILYNIFVLLTCNTSLLYRPFWLPREFTAVIFTAVYIPSQADTDAALKELYGHLYKTEDRAPRRCVYYNRGFQQSRS